jgi:hypothetical protein
MPGVPGWQAAGTASDSGTLKIIDARTRITHADGLIQFEVKISTCGNRSRQNWSKQSGMFHLGCSEELCVHHQLQPLLSLQ